VKEKQQKLEEKLEECAKQRALGGVRSVWRKNARTLGDEEREG
jgi:hypothetical protein